MIQRSTVASQTTFQRIILGRIANTGHFSELKDPKKDSHNSTISVGLLSPSYFLNATCIDGTRSPRCTSDSNRQAGFIRCPRKIYHPKYCRLFIAVALFRWILTSSSIIARNEVFCTETVQSPFPNLMARK
jgi:hypothetical protein